MSGERWGLYRTQPTFVLGFHGCDRDVAERVLAGEAQLLPSENPYDWLGRGVYFWEGSPHRALEWAQQMAAKKATKADHVRHPAVVGAVINLGACCNLFDSAALDEVHGAWQWLVAAAADTGIDLPKNKGKMPDFLLRYLDCAVIETTHSLREENKLPAYDSVRAPFPEGGPLYEGACFSRRSHIQIAVRKPEVCIQGYFRPVQFSA